MGIRRVLLLCRPGLLPEKVVTGRAVAPSKACQQIPGGSFAALFFTCRPAVAWIQRARIRYHVEILDLLRRQLPNIASIPSE